MKKILILLALLFPVIIFMIVNAGASAIARFIPIAVEGVEFRTPAYDFSDPGAVFSLDYHIIPDRAANKNVTFFCTDSEVASVAADGTVTLLQYGFAEITVTTEDGRYEAACDISVAPPGSDPQVPQASVLSYKTELHGDYLFGDTGSIKVGYKIYPVSAADSLTFSLEGGTVTRTERGSLTLVFDSAAAQSTARTLSVMHDGAELTSYSFSVRPGLNTYIADDGFFNALNAGTAVFFLDDIYISREIALTNGAKIYGNGKKLDHSGMAAYDNPDADPNTKAVTLKRASGIYNLRVVGKVTHDRLLYSRVHNVGVTGTQNLTEEDYLQNNFPDDGIEIDGCIIQNGKYNISLYGGYNIRITDTRLEGAHMAAVQLNNPRAPGYKIVTTEVKIRDIEIRLALAGFLFENNFLADGVRGSTTLNVLPSLTAGQPSVISDNWRNLDEAASGYAESFSAIKDELLKEYKDAIRVEDGEKYFNCVFVIMGGAPNYGTLNLLDPVLEGLLIRAVKAPSPAEALLLGGSKEYVAYVLKA